GRRLQRLPDQIGSEKDAGSQEADRHPEIVEPAWPLSRGDPGGQDGGPQRRGGVQDAGQSAADRDFAEADPEPGQRASEDSHDGEGEQAPSGPGGEGRLPPRGQDHAECEGAEQRASQHEGGRAHVLHGELDEEEARAPDQGEQDESRITTTHHVIMRRRDVTPYSGVWARWRARKYSGTEFMGGRSWSSISFCSIQ